MQSTVLTRSADAAPQTAPPTTTIEEAAWTLDALRTVWEHQQDRLRERIDTIECATAALANDRLDRELKHEAQRAAHMLAGSVGMFGFVDASLAAREIEIELEHPTPDAAPALSELLRDIRRIMQGPVTLTAAP
jgi:HPt (histidine-containing phosphotransfer) domain-containing protein